MEFYLIKKSAKKLCAMSFLLYFFVLSAAFASPPIVNIQLLGTVIKGDKQLDFAVISQNNDESKAYHHNDEIVSGVVLEQIKSDRIKVRSGDKTSEIKIGVPIQRNDIILPVLSSLNATTTAISGNEQTTHLTDIRPPKDLNIILIPDSTGNGFVNPEPSPFNDIDAFYR